MERLKKRFQISRCFIKQSFVRDTLNIFCVLQYIESDLMVPKCFFFFPFSQSYISMVHPVKEWHLEDSHQVQASCLWLQD